MGTRRRGVQWNAGHTRATLQSSGVRQVSLSRDSVEAIGRTTKAPPRGGGAARPRLPWCSAATSGSGVRQAAAVMLRALNRLAPRPGCQPSTVLVLPARGRKTRHDPPAKSKVGRVKMPPAVDPAEFFVLTERYRQYRQTVNALRCVERAGGHRHPPGILGRENGCQLEARPHPGKSSCRKCAGRRTRPGPGSWLSARCRRPPRSTVRSWPGTRRRTGGCSS